MNNIIAIITELGELEDRARKLTERAEAEVGRKAADGLYREISTAQAHLVRALQIAAEAMQ